MFAGLSDEVRADFHIMRDVAVHTRVSPASRHQTLTKFISNISRYSITSTSFFY